jgi:RNA polymerase sigma factor for flagellar operon FliA
MHKLIEKHIGYAHAIAADLLKKYPRLDRRDLESAAELGLVQAANDYDPSRGVSFTTFAYYRIRGAVLDDIRQVSRVSKFETSANDYMIAYTATTTGRTSRKAVAKDLKHLTASLVITYLLSEDTQTFDGSLPGTVSPIDQLIRTEQRNRLRKALRRLPARYYQVLHSYYYDDMSFKQIGHEIGFSESWVSRIHAQGLRMIRDEIQKSSKCAVAAREQKHQLFPINRHKEHNSPSITIGHYNGNYSNDHFNTTGRFQ